MTGFGKAVMQLPSKKITVEVKSLNSKQFDAVSRVPSIYRELELDLRKRVGDRLERGKVDILVTVETTGDAVATQQINLEALRCYKAQIEQLGQTLGLEQPDNWYSLLLRMPDAFRAELRQEATQEEVDALNKAVDQAVDALMEYRAAEGSKLYEFMTSRVEAISTLLAEVPRWEQERIAKIKSRMEDGLSKITQVEYDRGRLEQEMIYYIEKLDVNEEKQRLAQHLRYFIETLNLPTPGQGKKLGFIAQEMGREINTLGSKSNHAEMQQLVVKMKDELEQIKEQVLNIM
jgi:uncharacterized protein (TIGR00255 family)